MKRSILFLLSICVLLFSCDSDEDPYLSISKTEFSISDTGGSQSIMIDTNEGWTARSSQTWCTVSPADGGSSVRTAQITAEANDTHNDRSCTVTFTVGSISRTVNVTQGQKGGLLVTKNTFDISSISQIVEVELKTNIEVEVVIPQEAKSWVSYVGTRALESKTLSLNINENSEYSNRSAKIVIKNAANNLQETVTITQDADKGLIIGNDKFELSNEGGTIEVNVKANVEYEIEISDKWITQVETRGLTETTLQFQVAKNKNHDNREGTITISQKDGELSSTIKVYQTQEDAIILSENKVDISNEAQTIDVKIITNIDFEVIIPKEVQNWVSQIETRGLRLETVSLDIKANSAYDKRTAEVYIKNSETNIQDTLTINQDALLGLLVSQDTYEFTSEATSIAVEVQANVEYEVEISDDWITQVSTRGLTTTNLTFNIAENDTYGNREGTITFNQKCGDLSSTITISQLQNSAIIISETVYDISSRNKELEIKLNTNVDYEIIIPEEAKSWVSYIETRALRAETVVLNIAENSSEKMRSAKVQIKDKATDLQETITINQMGNVPGVYWVDKMGTLGTILSQTQKDTITTMIVKGEINKADFDVMKLEMPKLKYIDLKEVKCEGDRIPGSAFGENKNANKNISTIILPESITAIGEYAFQSCTGLTGNLILPDGVTTIGGWAFSSCTGLTGNLIIPDGVTTIGNNAFWGCSGFSGDLIIHGATTIGGYAFSFCSGFTGNLILPDGLTTIGDNAFTSCTGFTGNLILPDGVTEIGSSAFFNCYGFTGNLILPDGLTTIESSAFESCSGFTGLTIGKSVSTINESAFINCYNITGNVVFPESLISIRSEAFHYCYNIEAFKFPHTTPLTYYTNMLEKSVPVKVPNQAVSTYQSTNGWKDHTIVGY